MIKKIYISGMACNHCKKSVEDALITLNGVKTAVVDLDAKCATVETDGNIADNIFNDLIDGIGFTVDSIE